MLLWNVGRRTKNLRGKGPPILPAKGAVVSPVSFGYFGRACVIIVKAACRCSRWMSVFVEVEGQQVPCSISFYRYIHEALHISAFQHAPVVYLLKAFSLINHALSAAPVTRPICSPKAAEVPPA